MSVLDNLPSVALCGFADDHLLGSRAGDGGDQVVAVEDLYDGLVEVSGDDLASPGPADLDALACGGEAAVAADGPLSDLWGGQRNSRGGPAGRAPHKRPQAVASSGQDSAASKTSCSSRTCITVPSNRRVTRRPTNAQPILHRSPPRPT
ncbi:hypothetical protein GCM10009574_060850 [Streptomyces asiaticus]|uniref:Uncharacterized protein n=2 Tax=Streptomyces rhizosphaericus TaxID=114699 RepID=A0ABN1SJ22_9ACTN